MNTYPSTIDTRLRPLTAWRAVRALRDDPEDTRQIFVIFRALRGKSGYRLFARFADSANGRRILAERRSLLAALSDHDYLSALPAGSVGRTYLRFMQEEKLSADGLVMASGSDEPTLDPDIMLFRNRMRDAHDLTHILTGYGRDPLGELCLLAFMNRHVRNPGQLLIIAMAWKRMSGEARKAVWEAYCNGGKARWLVDQDYEAFLARPLDVVRRELAIRAPHRYEALAS
ncbi:Coq4 family protein [Sphingomonas sp.]|uniref:Coq4 family protein n=1 Tax=Sphingomonas sp. TaxID=28214 RepID=UPI003B3B5FBA